MLPNRMDVTHNFIQMLGTLYVPPLQAFIVFAALFILVRGRKALKRLSAGVMNESAHNLLLILVNGLVAAFLFGNLSFLSNFLFDYMSLPHLSQGFWTAIPSVLIFVFVLFALDFQNYCTHRALHTKYLWGFHALHHSDTSMTWTTYYRVHIFEWVMMTFVYTALLGWLFLPPEIVAFVGAIRAWYSKFIHCQLGWTFGRFRKVLASPNYHKWHHSISPEAYGKNLCDMFPLWDIVFKTHYDPGLCETALGVDDVEDGFIQGQIYPVKYAFEAIKKRLPSRLTTRSQIP